MARVRGSALRGVRNGDVRGGDGEVLGDRVITPMPVELALRTFLFHVRDFSTRRQLAIATDYASTREISKPKESHEAHDRFL